MPEIKKFQLEPSPPKDGGEDFDNKFLAEDHKSFSNAWERELKPGDPKVRFDFYFSLHGNPEDFTELGRHVQKANVVALEVAGWHPNDPDVLKRLSNGKLGLRDAVRAWGYDDPNSLEYQTWYEKFRPLANSRKPILLPDVQSGSSIQRKFEALQRQNPFSLKWNNFESEITALKKDSLEMAKIGLEREAHIQKELSRQLRVLLDSNDSLREKNSISVLSIYGSEHASLYPALKSKGEQGRAYYGQHPYYFSYGNLITLRAKMGKVVTREMLVRSIAEDIFYALGSGETGTAYEAVLGAKKVAEVLSEEDTREVYDLIADAKKGKVVDFEAKLRQKLNSVGIDLRTV